MIAIVYALHSLVCLALIVIVLLQTGKGSDIGSAFGGASQTVFGSGGRQTFMSRLTAGAAAVDLHVCACVHGCGVPLLLRVAVGGWLHR